MNNCEIAKFKVDEISLDVRISILDRTAWLSLKELSVLFNRDKSVISRHIKTIFEKQLLNEERVVAKNATVITQGDKKVTKQIVFYNLDVISLIGYQIDSNNGILLKEFVSKYIDAYYSKQDSSIIIYNNGDISLPVTISPNEETVWVEKDPLTNLFGTTRQNVEYHIENIYNQGELEKGATCKEILQVQLEGDRNVTRLVSTYNLDLIISLGYRINLPKTWIKRKMIFHIK